jgi:predicted nucleotide-binding protein (sugar kinase/HSP70/actin superfamily)
LIKAALTHLREAGIKEITNWIKYEAPKRLASQYQRELGKRFDTAMPSRRAINDGLKKLMKLGIVERVIGNKYR